MLKRLFLYCPSHAFAPTNKNFNTQVIDLESLIMCVLNVYMCSVRCVADWELTDAEFTSLCVRDRCGAQS